MLGFGSMALMYFPALALHHSIHASTTALIQAQVQQGKHAVAVLPRQWQPGPACPGWAPPKPLLLTLLSFAV